MLSSPVPQARRLPCTASSSSFNTTALPLADLRRHAAAAALGAALLAGGAAPSFAAAPDLQLGAEVFQNSCAACHTGGLNNIAGEEKHTLKRDALEKYKLYSTDAIEGQVRSRRFGSERSRVPVAVQRSLEVLVNDTIQRWVPQRGAA